MTDTLDINGKQFLPVRVAAERASYSRDYLARLAREQKILATQVGRQWFVNLDSVREYAELSERERELRHQELSAARKQEQAVRTRMADRLARANVRRSSFHLQAVMVASLVVTLGVMGGGVLTVVSHGVAHGWPEASMASRQTQGSLVSKAVPGAMSEDVSQPVSTTPSQPVATPDAVTVTAVPTQTVEPLGEERIAGVLLLPETDVATSAMAVRDLFSDPIALRTREDGVAIIEPVGHAGAATGPAVPYVMVPVRTDSL